MSDTQPSTILQTILQLSAHKCKPTPKLQSKPQSKLQSKPKQVAGLVYILANRRSNKTYVGWTVNFSQRIRRHNGEIKGGAKRTCVRVSKAEKGQWYAVAHVTGFTTRHQALSFEKYMHIQKNKRVNPLRLSQSIKTQIPRFKQYTIRRRIYKIYKIFIAYPHKFSNLQVEYL